MEDETDDGEVNPLSSLECEYTISRVGYYCLTVRLGKHHIRTSPGWVIGMPGRSHARSSVAYGPGLVVAHPHQVNTFTIESRDCLGNTRAGVVSVEEDEDETLIEKDDFVIGVIGPAMIEGGVIESQMDDYVSWRNGARDNRDGTFTVTYRMDPSVEIKPFTPIQFFIKLDDGTMFSEKSMMDYRGKTEGYREGYEEYKYTHGDPDENNQEEAVEVYNEETGEMEWQYPEEEEDEEDEVMQRPVEESRVNISGSPFQITISDHLPGHGDPARLRAHRPAAANDEVSGLKLERKQKI